MVDFQDRGRAFGRRRRLLGRRLLGASIGLIASLLLPAVASAIDEFPVGVKPGGITTGPDGALWFTEEGDNAVSFIGRFAPATGAYTHFQLPSLGSVPDKITTGPDGKLWFSEYGGNRIGRIDTAGNLTEFSNAGGSPQGITAGPGGLWYTATGSNTVRQIGTDGSFGAVYTIPTPSSGPSDIILGPDGKIWFTESDPINANKIGALNPSVPPGQAGAISEYPTAAGSEPSGIISTTGGILWFTEPGTNAIGRITTTGTLAEFPGAGVSASGIAAGRDGALWYTLGFSGTLPCTGTGDQAIGRITSGGTFTNKFATPSPLSDPSDITEGPDGALWFTEYCANKIGRIETAPSPPPPPPPPPVAVLSVSSLKLSPSSFKAAPKGASITKKKRKPGTAVTYRVSATASTRFTVESVQTGRKRGKKCVKQTAKNKRARKCTRYVVMKGSFKHAGKAGANRFRFSGRIGRKSLRAGKYRLVAVASVGTRKSKLRRANFKIVR
jgi:streptogramin lyase